MKKILMMCAIVLLAPMQALAEEATIYLVRHAEKQADSDPALTEQGRARAAALAEILNGVSISKVYSTDTRRTRQTAQPVADQKKLPIELYDPRAFREFADGLKAEFLSGTSSILVVGHSNTTPYLATLLTGEEHSMLSEDQYDHLYHVKKDADGQLTVTITKFNP